MTATPAAPELETRHHELRKSQMVMVDGNLIANLHSVQQGLSARACVAGYWGFASAPAPGGADADEDADAKPQ